MFHLDKSNFVPYIGGGVHYYYYKTSYSGTSNQNFTYQGSTQKVWSSSIETGFTYPLNKSFDLDCGIAIGKTFGVKDAGEVTYKGMSIGIDYLF